MRRCRRKRTVCTINTETELQLTKEPTYHSSLAANLVDLLLEVVHHLGRELVSQDLEEVDPLVPRDALVGADFDSLLHLQRFHEEARIRAPDAHLLDLRVLGDEECALRLLDGLLGVRVALLLRKGGGQGQEREQTDEHLHGCPGTAEVESAGESESCARTYLRGTHVRTVLAGCGVCCLYKPRYPRFPPFLGPKSDPKMLT